MIIGKSNVFSITGKRKRSWVEEKYFKEGRNIAQSWNVNLFHDIHNEESDGCQLYTLFKSSLK